MPSKTFIISKLILLSLWINSSFANQICTREYAPVCGQFTGDNSPKTYSNQCVMIANNASIVHNGECAAPAPTLIGNDSDAHGCKPSAGYLWSEKHARCIRPWLKNNNDLPFSQ